jgi:sugar/nucleoside kinase (ribokinase family)
MLPLAINPNPHYQALIGTGGIGSGVFFVLDGNHTLGREESRSGRFVERRDYCKLHITTHYVSTLTDPGFATIPLGMVGDDDVGRQLLHEMESAGLDLRHVAIAPGEQTLYGFCFLYPDGSGGNLTVNNSASAHVDPAFVGQAEEDFAAFATRGIALAMPEVPLAARMALLDLGSRYHFLRCASFLSVEMDEVRRQNLLDKVDLLAINMDEAMALVGIVGTPSAEVVVDAVIAMLQREHPAAIQLSITAGSRGSWAWDGRSITHVPAFNVPVVNTAGAGDAHFAGILVGLAAGLHLADAQELGTLVAALSVTSPDTINFGIDRCSLATLARTIQVTLAPAVRSLLQISV